jgi:hypothetical protein
VGQHLDRQHPLVRKSNRFYLTTAVVRSPSLRIAPEDNAGRAVDVDVDALQLVAAKTSMKIDRGLSGEVTFAGPTPLAFAVELYELVFDDERNEFSLRVPTQYVPTRGDGGVSAALLGGPNDDALMQVVEYSA